MQTISDNQTVLDQLAALPWPEFPSRMITVRLPERMYNALKTVAKLRGKSLNAYCVDTLRRGALADTAEAIQERKP